MAGQGTTKKENAHEVGLTSLPHPQNKELGKELADGLDLADEAVLAERLGARLAAGGGKEFRVGELRRKKWRSVMLMLRRETKEKGNGPEEKAAGFLRRARAGRAVVLSAEQRQVSWLLRWH